MCSDTPREINLFYDGFEKQARDIPFGRLRSDIREELRTRYRMMRGVQPYTGFYTAFRNLKRSLESRGINVRVNDFGHVRKNPKMPVGLSGFASVFDHVLLENPAIFGPGEVPLPDKVMPVVEQNHLKVVTQPSEWYCALWRDVLGDRIHPMPVAIDTEAWPNLSGHAKTLDVIVYDKIRWNRPEREADLLKPLLAHLKARKLSYEVLRYGHHGLDQFRSSLARGRVMVFICEHETQGLAYQEAMSSGVPILAWDDRQLVSPSDRKLAPEGLAVSSVPYFDERCGRRARLSEMCEAFDLFWEEKDSYAPRDYVVENLNLAAGAARYLELFSMIDGSAGG